MHKQGTMIAITLVAGLFLLSNQYKEGKQVLNDIMRTLEKINVVDGNISHLYDSMVSARNQKNALSTFADTQGYSDQSGNSFYTPSSDTLLSDDFKRIKLDVLNAWVESYAAGYLYKDNVPETTAEETKDVYYVENTLGEISEVDESDLETAISSEAATETSYEYIGPMGPVASTNENNSSESAVETSVAIVETVPTTTESSEEVEETTEDLVVEDQAVTFIVVELSKYYNSDTVNNIVYEVFESGESLGKTTDFGSAVSSQNLMLDTGYANSRIDLLEISGSHNIEDLTYKVSTLGRYSMFSTEELPVTISDTRSHSDYEIISLNNSIISALRVDPIIGANRIEVQEIIRESIVTPEETSNAESESTDELSEVETSAAVIPMGPIGGPMGGPMGTLTSSAVETNPAETMPRVVTVKDTDELYTLTYNFECWGPSEALRELTSYSPELVDIQNGQVFNQLKNMQCKFNDSKYNIDEHNKFVELDFSINIQIERSKLNKYLEETERDRIEYDTITSFKSRFNNLFMIQLSNGENSIIVNLQ